MHLVKMSDKTAPVHLGFPVMSRCVYNGVPCSLFAPAAHRSDLTVRSAPKQSDCDLALAYALLHPHASGMPPCMLLNSLMVCSLCYLYCRCTRSVSTCPPTYYAHLAAARARAMLTLTDSSDTASIDSGVSSTEVCALKLTMILYLPACMCQAVCLPSCANHY